jgi:hypothetical protein
VSVESANVVTKTVEAPYSSPTLSSTLSPASSPVPFPVPEPFASTMETALSCSVCAYHNSAGQKFCGMCGTLLQALPEQVLPVTHVPQVAEAAPVVGGSWCDGSLGSNSVESANEEAIDPAVSFIDARRARSDRELTWLRPQGDFPNFAVEAEPASSSYRLYVGAAVIVLLIVVGYMTWRGTEVLSGTTASQPASRAIPPAEPAPAVSAPTSATTSATTNPPTNQAENPMKRPAMSAVPTSAPQVSTAQHQTQRQSRGDASLPREQAVDSRPAPRIVSMAASSSPLPPEPSSAEDLATAEKYLNGSQGVPRDGEEGVRWLWKAEGKGNLAATMALADLFLRGDVLAKNCGQARVLLDVAAKKGSKAAGDRLRNLQAFGCQ